MHDLTWSKSEKKIVRLAFEAALCQELSDIMAEFKEKAMAAHEPGDMWAVEPWLSHRRRDIDNKYDFRYSRLVVLLGQLMRESRITDQQLAGLGAEKLAYIKRIAAL